MATPILARQPTLLDGVQGNVFREFAALVRRTVPRWVDGSRSLNRLTQRRAHQRERARSRRRGYCLVPAPAPSVSSGPVARRCGR
jgi:hypothetical protein